LRILGSSLRRSYRNSAECEAIRFFDANAAGENRRMIRVFYDSGFRVTGRTESGLTSPAVGSRWRRRRSCGGGRIATAAVRRTAASVADAITATESVAYPVAVKGLGPTLLHKTERGAVHLDLGDEQAVRSSRSDPSFRSSISTRSPC
jgi:hypothetical protein